MQISLRTIDLADWPVWRGLRLQALAEAPYAFGSTLSDWQGAGDTETRWRARLAWAGLNVVAHLGGEPAGMVSGVSRDTAGVVELISLWVAPSARGYGIGDALVAAIIDYAREQHAARITLAVVATNAPAIGLYRRHGFVDVGAIDCTGSGITSERELTLRLR